MFLIFLLNFHHQFSYSSNPHIFSRFLLHHESYFDSFPFLEFSNSHTLIKGHLWQPDFPTIIYIHIAKSASLKHYNKGEYDPIFIISFGKYLLAGLSVHYGFLLVFYFFPLFQTVLFFFLKSRNTQSIPFFFVNKKTYLRTRLLLTLVYQVLQCHIHVRGVAIDNIVGDYRRDYRNYHYRWNPKRLD